MTYNLHQLNHDTLTSFILFSISDDDTPFSPLIIFQEQSFFCFFPFFYFFLLFLAIRMLKCLRFWVEYTYG